MDGPVAGMDGMDGGGSDRWVAKREGRGMDGHTVCRDGWLRDRKMAGTDSGTDG